MRRTVGASVAPPPYLPFAEGPTGAFRWRLGLRPLDPHDWIEWGPGADAAVAAKPALMATDASTVFAVLDDRVEEESAEVGAAVVDHLRRRWPERFADVDLDRSLHPLDAAARLVPEDLVLLVERDGELVVGGGSVCFPNRWDLRSKLGSTMTGVHAPVARLNDQLGEPIDAVLARLTPARGFWRLGWTVIDTPDWYTPVDGTALAVPADVAPLDHALRVERETLRRLPRTGVVVFTIRTHVTPLRALTPADRADADDGGSAARQLATALRRLPSDVRAYKGLAAVAEDVAQALEGAGFR